jgi:hypothetical protein
MLNRSSINIAFSTEALKANLSRLEDEWENYQNTRDRDGIYGYLAAVFELVMWWKHEQKAIEYARRALWLKGQRTLVREPEPYAAVIFAPPILKKWIIGCGVSGRGCCGMLRCTGIWMSRYRTLSSARVVSINARLDIPAASGEVRVQVNK